MNISDDYRLLVILARANQMTPSPIFTDYDELSMLARRMAGVPEPLRVVLDAPPYVEQMRALVAEWRRLNTPT